MGTLAIVIPAYRSERTARRSLEAFVREAPAAEIVLVDSAPDGASGAAVADVTGVRVLHPGTRLLPHAARTVGAEATAADLLLFSDPDVYPRPGSVARLLDAQATLGGAVGAALACHGNGVVDQAAHVAKFGPWLPCPDRRAVDILPTAGLLVARADWERVGGFGHGGMLADTTFSWALADAGIPRTLVGDAVFEHDHGTTAGALLHERFERGRTFSALRRGRWPGTTARTLDVAATVTLVRPARGAARRVTGAWHGVGPGTALRSAPLVAAAEVAWFAGELAGHAAAAREGRR